LSWNHYSDIDHFLDLIKRDYLYCLAPLETVKTDLEPNPEDYPLENKQANQITRAHINSIPYLFPLDTIDSHTTPRSPFLDFILEVFLAICKTFAHAYTAIMTVFGTIYAAFSNAFALLSSALSLLYSTFEATTMAILTWPFEDISYQHLSSGMLHYGSSLNEDQVMALKERKNFGSSSSGANVLKATSGIVNKGAILASDDE
jgi:hypothetical protein